ncbi:MAG TPA: type III pantothenate kinase [Gammaproteobacteria bacterium]|nr:type III pantothenate kinase [Gammaproteobacteria bacterium]
MKLLIDLGNTRLKWAAWHAGEWLGEGSQVLQDEPVERIVEWLRAAPEPREIWIASVAAGERAQRVAEACERAFGLVPRRAVTTAEACGVRCAYAEPARLGVDRWLAVIGAYSAARRPAVIFDCGTAITVDAVTATGGHLGGLIIPGIGLMRQALFSATAGIPREDEGDVGLLARDTRSAVSGGTLYAAVAFVQHVAGELRAALGADTRFIITGGDAERLRPLLQGDFETRPQLVLEGLLAVSGEAGCE